MIKKFIRQNSERFLSRWVVLCFDLTIVGLAYYMALVLRYNLEMTVIPSVLVRDKIFLVLAAYLLGFLITRSYVGIIRHTSLTDAYALFKGAMMALAVFFISTLAALVIPSAESYLTLPNSVIVIHFLLSLFVLIGSRLVVKILFERLKSSHEVKKTRVLIYGAGASGIITKNTLLQDTSREYDVQGFIDDNPYKVGKSIEGTVVYSRDKALKKGFVTKNRTDQLIISIQERLEPQHRASIVEDALLLGMEVKAVPAASKWIHGELSAKQIKQVKIEELLERAPINLDNKNVKREIEDKVVLVTGAAGSIGSEISRQLLHHKPHKVIMLDAAESPLYDLQHEIKSQYPQYLDLIDLVIADVRNRERMARVFEVFQPDMVFHAAAYKHVPLMEDNPYEAIGVNVFGTQNVADLSVQYKVEKFVFVSTDKAVNPTNVMGATKRAAEMYTRGLNRQNEVTTQFITTRFGNVLGSNGSVIPLFRRQIARGGPITLTDKRITRYFMTIPEACNLVLEAGAMGHGGEIFVFDMGKSVKIYDLACKMIMLSGLELGKDIEIREVGLRPGEKLFEELLTVKEKTTSTHHPKIMIAQTEKYKFSEVQRKMAKLTEHSNNPKNLELVACLKNLVPEYKSNNSIYASLDETKNEPDAKS